MAKFVVEVVQVFEVELDETKFTSAFLEEYRAFMHPLFDLRDHAENIAQLEARGLLDEDFTEGYGPLKEMGISARVVSGYETTEVGQ